jgi:hypothetical protein
MRRLAEQLAKVQISLDPPSPPSLISPTDPHIDRNLLTVPGETGIESIGGGIFEPRLYSPPPDRRGSNASTTSDASLGSSVLSATLPTSNSYQNLLSPTQWCGAGGGVYTTACGAGSLDGDDALMPDVPCSQVAAGN